MESKENHLPVLTQYLGVIFFFRFYEDIYMFFVTLSLCATIVAIGERSQGSTLQLHVQLPA